MVDQSERESAKQWGIDHLQELITTGNINSARQIIDKNRKQVQWAIANDQDPPGHLMEKLTTCMAKGWIGELYTVGNFSGPLEVLNRSKKK